MNNPKLKLKELKELKELKKYYIIYHLSEDDGEYWCEKIESEGKQKVFGTLIKLFFVNHKDLLENFTLEETPNYPWESMCKDNPKVFPNWEVLNQNGYIMAWNSRTSELYFCQHK